MDWDVGDVKGRGTEARWTGKGGKHLNPLTSSAEPAEVMCTVMLASHVCMALMHDPACAARAQELKEIERDKASGVVVNIKDSNLQVC